MDRPSRQPSQRHRVRNCTPRASNRFSHARSSGDAFIATGKTRPVEPTNTSWPRPVAHRTTSGGPNAESARAKAGETAPYAASKWSSSFVRFRPDLPAIRNLRAGDGIWSAMTTETPASESTSAAISPAGPAPMTSARVRFPLWRSPVSHQRPLAGGPWGSPAPGSDALTPRHRVLGGRSSQERAESECVVSSCRSAAGRQTTALPRLTSRSPGVLTQEWPLAPEAERGTACCRMQRRVRRH